MISRASSILKYAKIKYTSHIYFSTGETCVVQNIHQHPFQWKRQKKKENKRKNDLRKMQMKRDTAVM